MVLSDREKINTHQLVKSNKSISRKNILTKFHFLQFQKWPNIYFWTGKKFKTAKNAVFHIKKKSKKITWNCIFGSFFPVQKLILGQFWNCKKWILFKIFFREIDLFDFTSFFGLDFFKFSGLLWKKATYIRTFVWYYSNRLKKSFF